MRIYLDMCCYNRPYDDQSQMKVNLEAQAKLQIQKWIVEKKYDLIGSYTLDYEVSKNPFEMRRESIASFIYTNMSGYIGIERDDIITSMSKEIMATGVKEKDAFHTASAIYAGCDYFISTDSRLLKYRTDKIKLVNPVEFVAEMEGE